jgi:uncharacterized membrane protein
MIAIVFALCSMLCAAVNDYIFKLYSRRNEAVGLYMAVIGIVWASICTSAVFYRGELFLGQETLKWGLISGLLSAFANILLIESMAKNEVGVCSTIYRLNLAPAAILAFIFLDEPVTSFKLLGIGAALIGVLALSDLRLNKSSVKTGIIRWIIVAALLRALMGIAYKYGLSMGGNALEVLAINAIMWVVAGLAYTVYIEKKALIISRECIGYGFSSGVLACGITLFLMLALQTGQASVVLPIAQLSFLITGIIGVAMLSEVLNVRKVLGFTMGLICILFMALNR